MVKNQKNKFIFDTSSFLSLESAGLLKVVLEKYGIITTLSVINELKSFAQYDDRLGMIAKKVLKYKDKIMIKDQPIKEKLLHVSKTDEELFNLALHEKIILITDDIKFSRHADPKIETEFSTYFLAFLVNSKDITKQQALDSLELMRDIRNWQDNIIYISTKEILEKIED